MMLPESIESIKIFDGHNDSLMSCYHHPVFRDLSIESDQGHFDIPRALKGNFLGGLFAVFVPSPNHENSNSHFILPDPVSQAYAKKITDKGIDSLRQLEKKSSGSLKQVFSFKEIDYFFKKNVIAALLHFEGAEVIKKDLSNLEQYYHKGLRSLGLTWSRKNDFAGGVEYKFPATPDTGAGLTSAGKDLVKACNEMGILIDLSHLNEKGFWDVEKRSCHPLVATHSCMHGLSKSSRNLTDKQLYAIKASNGIVGLNFCTAFLRKDGRLTPETPLSELIRHFCYGVEKMGIDHVALGSDFDGGIIPMEIKDVTGLIKILDALGKEGFDIESLEKIAYKNWFRVLKNTLKE